MLYSGDELNLTLSPEMLQSHYDTEKDKLMKLVAVVSGLNGALGGRAGGAALHASGGALQ